MNIKTANKLCELRKANGFSQEELANKLGVSRQAVSKWERSESSPDTDNLIELAKLYNISLDELLNDDEAIEIINENKEANKEENAETLKLTDDEGQSLEFDKGIKMTDSDGSSVQFTNGKVVITKKDGTKEELTKEQYKEKMFYRKHPVLSVISGLWGFGLIISYIVLGFVLPNNQGWSNYWFLFILIPVLPSFFSCFVKKKVSEFAFPCLVAAIYCALGMMLGMWHPLWVMFLAIPAFYIITAPIDRHFDNDED